MVWGLAVSPSVPNAWSGSVQDTVRLFIGIASSGGLESPKGMAVSSSEGGRGWLDREV